MKIFGFLQVKDEISTGHLDRFLSKNSELFDELFAWDDGSCDETPDVLEAFGARVFRNTARNFQNESINKAKLLEAIIDSAEEGDAILWLDADEVMFCSRFELQQLVESKFQLGYDSISFEHLNLWRSNAHFRIDDGYFGLRPVRIWRVSKGLEFERRAGLHQQTHPGGLRATFHSSDYPVFHYGFATLEAILSKYARYHLDWQSGYPLDRLVTEAGRSLLHVAEFTGRLGSRFLLNQEVGQDEPKIIPELEWRFMARKARKAAEDTITPLITVVCLIFKSVEWLEFSYGEALKLRRDFRRGEVRILFVANNASLAVLDFLKQNHIPHIESSGRKSKGEWYINSVYRSYNEGVLAAETPLVFLINSDMAFERGSLRNLYLSHTHKKLSTSRLIERGRLVPGTHALEKDLGSHPRNFRRKDFEKYAKKIAEPGTLTSGLYMPLLCERAVFENFGGFPEGNLRTENLGSYLDGGPPIYASLGESLKPGDAAFFELLTKFGYQHVTQLNSICYHFQEGELTAGRDSKTASGIALKNDLMVGINGEEVLWTRLAKRFNLDSKTGLLFTGMPTTKLAHVLNPLRLALQKGRRRFRVGLSNATFQLPQRVGLRDIVLVQDRPSGLLSRSLQKLSLLKSDLVVTNDLQFASQRPKLSRFWFNVEVPPLFTVNLPPTGSAKKRSSHKGLFVGALGATKGEDRLRQLVLENPEVDWTLISKYESQPPAWMQKAGVTFLTALTHDQVREAMKSTDFLVSTSPWETQHLVSIEAVALGIPVFITPTGLLGYQRLGREQFGFVSSENFLAEFSLFLGELSSYDPRGWFEQFDWSGESDLVGFIHGVLEDSFESPRALRKLKVFVGRVQSFLLIRVRLFLRSSLVPLALRVLRKGKRVTSARLSEPH